MMTEHGEREEATLRAANRVGRCLLDERSSYGARRGSDQGVLHNASERAGRKQSVALPATRAVPHTTCGLLAPTRCREHLGPTRPQQSHSPINCTSHGENQATFSHLDISLTILVKLKNSSDLSLGRRPESESRGLYRFTKRVSEIWSIHTTKSTKN